MMRKNIIEWDSKIFNKNVFEIEDTAYFDKKELKEIDESCISEKAFMSYIKITTLDLEKIHFLESLGFNYMESQFALKKVIKKPCEQLPLNRHFCIRKLDYDDNRSILDINAIITTTFDTDRYYLDPKLDKKYSGLRYKNWFLNSFKNIDYETYVYLSKKDNQIIGFYMIQKKNNEIDLLLAGIKKELKGFGIFPMFLTDVINFAFSQGFKTFYSSISSHNVEVFNIYIYLGFSVVDEKIVMRKIYEKSKHDTQVP